MKFGGRFLFDIFEHCGKWRELNYRGYIEVWKHEERGDILVLEPYEEAGDEEDIWELWWGDEKTGHCESIFFGPYEEAKKMAFEFMKENP
jgi:hypothetical protein